MRNIVALSVSALVSVFALGACSSDAGSKDQVAFDHGDNTGGNAVSAPSFEAKPYPAAPYGTQIGSVVAPLEWLGWNDGALSAYDVNSFENIGMADFHDPTGEKGVQLLFVNASAVWCTVCRAEYKYLKDAKIYEKYSGGMKRCDPNGDVDKECGGNTCHANVFEEDGQGPTGGCAYLGQRCIATAPDCGGLKCVDGIHPDDETGRHGVCTGMQFVGAIFEDGASPPNPAKPDNLVWWGTNYDVKFPLVLDPGFKTGAFFTADATPMNLLVDAKTMQIVGKVLGGDTTALFAQADKLLAGG